MRLGRAILLFSLYALACQAGEPNTERSAANDLEVPAAATLIHDTKDLVVVDVRSADEFASGHIEGALNLDVDRENFQARLGELDATRPHLVHCAAGAAGGRSRRAVEAMRRLGFEEVYHLDGGINAWKQAEHPVATP